MPFGPFKRTAPIRVQPFYGFRNAERLFLNARALRDREAVFERSGFLRSVRTMAGQYLSNEVAGLEVELEYETAGGATLRESVVTDDEGFAHFDLPLSGKAEHPVETRWEKAVLRWSREDGSRHEKGAFILTPGSKTPMGIISDIDDTILETGITGNIRKIARNWKRVMAQMPGERKVVPGASDFYSALGGEPDVPDPPSDQIEALAPRARINPVFYVSSSPWNLFSYLVTFKRQRGLPLGPVMLRDWGFNRRTLGKEGHGSHKRDAIARILDMFPHLRFALIGDDTQKDMAAFGSIAAEFPGRIAAIFIRSISGEALDAGEVEAKVKIEKAGVPLWTGSDYTGARNFLRDAGLEIEGGVKTLVKAATEGEKGVTPAAPAA